MPRTVRIGSVSRPRLERLAQAPDMDIDGALVDIDVAAPYRIEKLRAAVHAARVLHQMFEQAELGRRQVDVARPPGDPPGAAVKREIAGLAASRRRHRDWPAAGCVRTRAISSGTEKGLTI